MRRQYVRTINGLDRKVHGMWNVEDEEALTVAARVGKLMPAADICMDGILVAIEQ